ncbi:MAG: aldo/keto reductase [Terriglobales bacterium]|jgi:diketogulonate reductase-like aldo/keto reductase
MRTRELGKTGVSLPAVGLGTWQYTGGVEPLRDGVGAGARFIDTAESYGSEGIVGEAIRAVRKDIFLATKVSPRHFKYSEVITAANQSLRRLNTDYIDLYQLHWPNYTVSIEETMGAMEALVESGKIRFIGVSNFMLRDLKRAQRAMTKYKIVSNQVRYNLIDRTIEQTLLKYCQNHSITVIAHSPLASGLGNILRSDPQQVLDTVAKSRSKTAAQVALAWCLSKECVVVIPKANSVAHTMENCGASGFDLSPEDRKILDLGVRSRRRGAVEIGLRRIARHALQVLGRNQ